MSIVDPTSLSTLEANGKGISRSPPPVPRLSLDAMPPPTDGCAGSLPPQPLTCGSDRSTGTQAHAAPLAAPAQGTPTAQPGLPPLPPPPLPYSEPSTPRCAAFASPRSLTLAPLSLASPRQQAPGSAPPAVPSDAAMRTPRSPPMLSPHSPRSPSMMSPLRMVGTRSPCSVRVSGTLVRLCSDGTIRQTPTRAAPATAPARASQENASGGDGNGNIAKRPHVSRVLPFSQPTADAQAAAAARAAAPDLQRFSAPLPLGCRELSFSDLLNPKPPAMPPLSSSLPSRPAPVRVPVRSPSAGGAASLPASPLGSPTTGDGAATPRKRPRKSSAPQRADFGGGDAAGDSSAGETSGNGAVAMAWDEDPHPGQTSPAKGKHAKR